MNYEQDVRDVIDPARVDPTGTDGGDEKAAVTFRYEVLFARVSTLIEEIEEVRVSLEEVREEYEELVVASGISRRASPSHEKIVAGVDELRLRRLRAEGALNAIADLCAENT